MLSARECLTKAAAMEAIALSASPEIAIYFRELAQVWRWVAGQAQWQDEFQKAHGPLH